MTTRFSKGEMPASISSPTGDGRIHLRTRTWPTGNIKDNYYDIPDAKNLLMLWRNNLEGFSWTKEELDEFELAIELEEANDSNS